MKVVKITLIVVATLTALPIVIFGGLAVLGVIMNSLVTHAVK